MAGSYDFFLSEPIDAAREHVAAAITAQGFTLESTPSGGFIATRGSATRTLLLGAFAGKKMHLRFDVQFFQDDQNRIVVRLNRDLGSSALKGGVIGASNAASAFTAFATNVRTALHATGTLVAATEA